VSTSPAVIRIGATRVDLTAHEAVRDPEVISLSPQEVAILRTFVERGPDATLTRAELYREAWGYTREPRGRALDYAMRRLREKLGASAPNGPVLGTVRGVGYRLHWAPASEPPSSLVEDPVQPAPPASSTGLIARDGLLAEAMAVLQSPGVLLSLVGPGGVGKSSVAEALMARMPSGTAVWVDLEAAPVGGAGAAVERALFGQREGTASLAERVAQQAAVDETERVLVLDGGERHTDELVSLIGDLLGPRLRVLLTTRERLLLRAEHALAVSPLSAEDAFELLRRIARQRGLHDDLDAASAAPLLAQLDGLPLAVELAAASLRGRPPEALAAALAEGRPLRSRERDRDARHASMAAVVRSSVERLPEDAREALHALCAFQGSFGVEAAGWALGVDAFDAEDLIEVLLDRSMVSAVSSGGNAGYRVLRPTRSVMVSDRGEPTVALGRLRARFSELGEADAVRVLGRQRGGLAPLLRLHIEDVLMAFRTDPSPSAGLALLTLLAIPMTGPWETVQEIGRAVLHSTPMDTPLQALAVMKAAVRAGDIDRLRAVLDGFPGGDPAISRLVELERVAGPTADPAAVEAQARALLEDAREHQDRYVEARAAEALGVAVLHRGALEEADEAYKAYLRAAEMDGHLDNQISAWSRLGQVAFHANRIDAAIRSLEMARQLAGESHRYAGTLVSNLGLIHLQQGNLEAAAVAVRQGVALARRDANLPQVCLSLSTLSDILSELGESEEARQMAEQSVELAIRHLAVPGAADRSWAHLALIHCEAGAFEAADAVRQRWRARFGPSSSPLTVAMLEALEAWVDAGLGDTEAARERLVDADGRSPLPSDHLTPHAAITRHYFAGRAWLLLGDTERAAAESTAARKFVGHQHITPHLVARIDRLLLAVETAAGRAQ
jgi:tetratricopeptide (TPR) repeat protein/DNA-binding winged helix-turn-helix (wHTH) protein